MRYSFKDNANSFIEIVVYKKKIGNLQFVVVVYFFCPYNTTLISRTAEKRKLQTELKVNLLMHILIYTIPVTKRIFVY